MFGCKPEDLNPGDLQWEEKTDSDINFWLPHVHTCAVPSPHTQREGERGRKRKRYVHTQVLIHLSGGRNCSSNSGSQSSWVSALSVSYAPCHHIVNSSVCLYFINPSFIKCFLAMSIATNEKNYSSYAFYIGLIIPVGYHSLYRINLA